MSLRDILRLRSRGRDIAFADLSNIVINDVMSTVIAIETDRKLTCAQILRLMATNKNILSSFSNYEISVKGRQVVAKQIFQLKVFTFALTFFWFFDVTTKDNDARKIINNNQSKEKVLQGLKNLYGDGDVGWRFRLSAFSFARRIFTKESRTSQSLNWREIVTKTSLSLSC